MIKCALRDHQFFFKKTRFENQKGHRYRQVSRGCAFYVGRLNGRREMNEIKEKILVIGFNSRPIVASAVKLGYDVVCIDYWGDLDLRRMCEEVFSPISQTPGKSIQHPSIKEKFFLSAVKKVAKKHEDIEFALIDRKSVV